MSTRSARPARGDPARRPALRSAHAPQDRHDRRASMAAIREIWASRRGARTRADVAYLVYLVVLSIAILVVPALRMIGVGLARPDVVPVLLADVAPQAVTAASLVAGAALVLIGAARGPALLAPFFTTTLAAGPMPRRTALWRPFARALLVPVTAVVTIAALIAATLLTVGRADLAAASWFVLAALGSGLLLGAAWLLGELIPGAPRRLLAVLLALAAVLLGLLPVPVGPGAAYPLLGTGDGGALWAIGLAAAGVLAVLACVPLLDRLRGEVLLEQSTRWESATTTAITGDLAAATGAFRARPTTGRRLPAIGAGPLVLLYARRDAVAWLRTPERTVTGLLVIGGSAAALAGGLLATGPLAWVAIAAGVLGLWFATGSFADGIRHAVHTLGAPPLLGQTAAVQALLHAVAPTLLMMLVGAIGAGAVALTGPDVGDPAVLRALLVPIVLAPVLVALRVHASAKGPMPLKLATPMPTAQGDLSVIPMLTWQSDAILLALLAGGMTVLAALLGPLWVAGTVAVLLLGIVGLTRARLRELAT